MSNIKKDIIKAIESTTYHENHFSEFITERILDLPYFQNVQKLVDGVNMLAVHLEVMGSESGEIASEFRNLIIPFTAVQGESDER